MVASSSDLDEVCRLTFSGYEISCLPEQIICNDLVRQRL
jgi:hypothetical protein